MPVSSPGTQFGREAWDVGRGRQGGREREREPSYREAGWLAATHLSAKVQELARLGSSAERVFIEGVYFCFFVFF